MRVTFKKAADDKSIRGALEKYMEKVIESKAGALCMDVQSERRRLAKLVASIAEAAATLDDETYILRDNDMFVRCQCGRGLVLRLLGGQYQDSYVGRCVCKKGWFLGDVPAQLPL